MSLSSDRRAVVRLAVRATAGNAQLDDLRTQPCLRRVARYKSEVTCIRIQCFSFVPGERLELSRP